MATIYICTSGEYSDYGINAVFDKKELAEEFCSRYGGYHRRWELNPKGKELRLGYRVYVVTMNKDGDTVEARETNFFADETTWGIRHDGLMYLTCWAKSDQHAVKIANEHRVQMIANNEWKPGTYFPKK